MTSGDVYKLCEEIRDISGHTFKADAYCRVALLRCYRRQTIIVPSLTNLFNLLLELEVPQRDWKLAKVTPIYKNDKKCVPGNYRPISVLPAVTKLIEKNYLFLSLRLSHKRWFTFDSQSSFRPLHSFLAALLDVTNDWFLNMDKGVLMVPYS